MKWFEQFTLVMRSSITTLREKVENPERMLHQLIVDMEEELTTVRAGVAEAIADEIQLGKRAKQAREEAETWLERASKALKRNDEATAKAALDQKASAIERADALHREHEQQKQQTQKLQQSVRDLEDRIRQARQKRTLLLARLSRAESSQKINAALDRTTSQSAFAEFSRLEQKVERSEALSDAYDRLEGRDPDAAELERQFEADERRERVQAELEALKRNVSESH